MLLKSDTQPVWVVGHQGMLGHQVVKALKAKGLRPVWASEYLASFQDVMRYAHHRRPGAIINCAGIIPNRRRMPPAGVTDAVRVNAELPHALAQVGVPMIHMSTDCVYSGRQAPEKDRPDPTDIYGRTKLAGEPLMPNVVVVRGSFIGPEHGFLNWLITAKGGVDAWAGALWSGTSAQVMGEALVGILVGDLKIHGDPHGERPGGNVIHLAIAEPVTKAYLVNYFIRELGLELTVNHKITPAINRTLVPDITLPNLDLALEALVAQLKEPLRV